jgi:hypothetical protein
VREINGSPKYNVGDIIWNYILDVKFDKDRIMGNLIVCNVLAFPEWKDKLNSRFKGYVNVKINRFK